MFIFIERKIGNKRLRKIPLVLTHIYSKIVIILGFGIFYFEDLGRLGQFFSGLVGANGNAFTDTALQTAFMNNVFLFAAAVILCMPVIPTVKKRVMTKAAGMAVTGMAQIVCNVVLLAVCSIMLVNNTNNPFLYFIF